MRDSTAPRAQSAFTLIEMLVSMAIVGLLVIVLVQVTGQTSRTWRYTSGKIEQFREARNAFETVTTRLSQATLNTYWDYDYDTAVPPSPTRYSRHSELRFLSGKAAMDETLLGNNGTATRLTHCAFFHAPLGYLDSTSSFRGLEGLLNVWGYFVEFDDDAKLRPPVLNTVRPNLPTRYRFRLMELMLSSDQLSTYSKELPYVSKNQPSDNYIKTDWFKDAVNGSTPPVHVLAENIVALVLQPSLSKQDQADLVKYKSRGGQSTDGVLAPAYTFDSTNQLPAANRVSSIPELNPKNQLPPVVRVTMVAIDEETASRLRLNAGSANVFGVNGKFSLASKYAADLQFDSRGGTSGSLENTLISLKANYRIFTSDVSIRAAKWSREQSDK